VDQVDGKDVREQQQKRLRGEELLRPHGDLNEELRADAPEQAIQLGLRVLRIPMRIRLQNP
jgi:hypothetical protein